MANELRVQIEKRFAKGPAIEAAVQLDTCQGPAVTVLFGPSGSGKTTILRCLAGLEVPERGFIHFDGEVWFDAQQRISLSPQRRRVGYLSQDYALFPHLTVRQNLEYGLCDRAKAEREKRVTEMVSLLQIEGLERRYPRELSGGQLQRVALARTVAPAPRLLLLDEPLSALDDATRSRVRTELRRLLTELGIPTLVVTHDRTEAIALGDHMAVVVQGRIQQTGSVEEVFSRPANDMVAASVGVETVIPGIVIAFDSDLLTVQASQVQIFAVDPGDVQRPEVYLCIRAEEVILSKTLDSQESARNRLPGVVTSVLQEGSLIRVGLDCGIPLVAFVTKPARDDMNLKKGDSVTAVIKATSVHVIPRTRGAPR